MAKKDGLFSEIGSLVRLPGAKLKAFSASRTAKATKGKLSKRMLGNDLQGKQGANRNSRAMGVNPNSSYKNKVAKAANLVLNNNKGR